MTSTQLQEIVDSIDASKIKADTLRELHKDLAALRAREQRLEEDERRRREAVPQVVPSWRDVSPGTIVVRSKHWKDNNFKPDNVQIGIVTDMKICEDDICVAVYWPVVHWEGESHSSMNHPLNVACRDGRTLPFVTMNANQQRKQA